LVQYHRAVLSLPASSFSCALTFSQPDPMLLASCYHSALELASKHNIRTIAFPCIGAGAKSFPLDVHAQVALQTVRRWLEKGKPEGRQRRQNKKEPRVGRALKADDEVWPNFW
jgi:O-acetyl-ADP-ribose deacetylase (regulator of RNase III)